MRSTKSARRAVVTRTSMSQRRRRRAKSKGPVREMTPEWKDLVLVALRQRGKGIPWLADELGLSPSAGYKLFATKPDGSMVQTGSAEVPRICALLDVPPPLVGTPPLPEPRDARIRELLLEAPDTLKDAVIEILSRSTKSRSDL